MITTGTRVIHPEGIGTVCRIFTGSDGTERADVDLDDSHTTIGGCPVEVLEPADRLECPHCDGQGYVEWSEDQWSHSAGHYTADGADECDECDGTGEVEPTTDLAGLAAREAMSEPDAFADLLERGWAHMHDTELRAAVEAGVVRVVHCQQARDGEPPRMLVKEIR